MNSARIDGKRNPLDQLIGLLELMKRPDPKRKPEKTLAGAACYDDFEGVKRFLAAGSTPKDREAALGYAVSRRNLGMVNALLSAGPTNAGPALARAAELGDMAIVRRLLEEPVDL